MFLNEGMPGTPDNVVPLRPEDEALAKEVEEAETVAGAEDDDTPDVLEMMGQAA